MQITRDNWIKCITFLRKHVCWEQLEFQGKFLRTMIKQEELGYVGCDMKKSNEIENLE